MNCFVDLDTKEILGRLGKDVVAIEDLQRENIEIAYIDSPIDAEGNLRILTDEEIKPYLISKINNEFNTAISVATGTTPTLEKDTWLQQKLEALAWTEDNTVDTPFIDGIMSTREKYKNDKAGLVAKILSKAESAFELGAITGARQDKEDKL